MKPEPSELRPIRDNKKAQHAYELLDRWEAGLALLGTEVKSIREGKVSIDQAYAKLRGKEVFVVGMNVTPYANAGRHLNHEPTRPRKLLLRRSEIRRIASKVRERGYTLVPLRLYFNKKGLVKLEIALARGKTRYDKREAIRKRESERQMRRYRR